MRKSLLLSLITLAIFVIIQSCSKEYSVETGSGGTPATGELIKDADGLCLLPEIHGIYDTAKVLTDSNYVLINVNVTKPGFYRVYTDEQNGFRFTDSGYFSVIGTKTVKLKATGTPILNIPTDFVVNFDSTVCSFVISVTENDGENTTNPNTSDSAWVFSDGAKTYAGTISSCSFYDQVDPNGGVDPKHYFEFHGYIPNHSDSSIHIVMEVPAPNAIPATTYSTSTAALFNFSKIDATNPLGYYNIYEASPQIPSQVLQITVHSYNSTTHVVDATFAGTARTTSGGTATISNGRFKVKAE